MLSSAATAALRGIAHHIDLAIRFTASFDYQSFEADSRTVYAVTRCLEIISVTSAAGRPQGEAPLDCMEGYGWSGQHLSP
jgi:hypothetical protein